jgi:hypothetical protein
VKFLWWDNRSKPGGELGNMGVAPDQPTKGDLQ